MRAPTLLLLLLPLLSVAQDITGRWVTIDEHTHKKRSVVEIYMKGDKAYGKVVQAFREPNEPPDPICEKCDPKDDRYRKKVIGMEIIRDLERDGDAWENGTVLDPRDGRIYDLKVWVENGKLQVRGYFLFFYRTQEWVRESL